MAQSRTFASIGPSLGMLFLLRSTIVSSSFAFLKTCFSRGLAHWERFTLLEALYKCLKIIQYKYNIKLHISINGGVPIRRTFRRLVVQIVYARYDFSS